MQPGSTITVKEIAEEDGMYKVAITTSTGQEISSYLSLDGTKFFPQAMVIAEVESQKKAAANPTDTAAAGTPATPVVTKAKKANVELFVMSHCPYGTQIEKGIIPAIQALGQDVDFSIKFCDYAMHGEKELLEQLNQSCIQSGQVDKFIPYLNCFLTAGDGAACLKTAGINTAKLKTCTTAADKKFEVTKLFADKTTWVSGQFPQFNIDKADNTKYGVKGSPTLVVNGASVSAARDSASLLKTICAGYETAPDACKETLSSATPAPGFGAGTTDSAAAANCGS
jgi:hypothetical protein